MDSLRFEKTIAAFDLENKKDPNKETVKGIEYPKELLYSLRMSACLLDYTPHASEALRLAGRCQHIRRWEIARESFPAGRKGYLAWRSRLKERHAEIARAIMVQNGYEEETIGQVENLLKKKGLKTEPEVQILEDVVCIVFLKYYFKDFAPRYDPDKIKSILLKTMNKMSEQGIAYASALNNSSDFLKYLPA